MAEKVERLRVPAPDPVEMFNTHGADALRWYMISSPLLSGGDLAMPRDGRAIGDAVRQVLLPLWNAYSFFTLYANIDGIRGKMITTAEADLDREFSPGSLLEGSSVRLRDIVEALEQHLGLAPESATAPAGAETP